MEQKKHLVGLNDQQVLESRQKYGENITIIKLLRY